MTRALSVTDAFDALMCRLDVLDAPCDRQPVYSVWYSFNDGCWKWAADDRSGVT